VYRRALSAPVSPRRYGFLCNLVSSGIVSKAGRVYGTLRGRLYNDTKGKAIWYRNQAIGNDLHSPLFTAQRIPHSNSRVLTEVWIDKYIYIDISCMYWTDELNRRLCFNSFPCCCIPVCSSSRGPYYVLYRPCALSCGVCFDTVRGTAPPKTMFFPINWSNCLTCLSNYL